MTGIIMVFRVIGIWFFNFVEWHWYISTVGLQSISFQTEKNLTDPLNF